jgi:hypothetical protein
VPKCGCFEARFADCTVETAAGQILAAAAVLHRDNIGALAIVARTASGCKLNNYRITPPTRNVARCFLVILDGRGADRLLAGPGSDHNGEVFNIRRSCRLRMNVLFPPSLLKAR